MNGKRTGDDADYELPNGRTASVKILAAKPYTG